MGCGHNNLCYTQTLSLHHLTISLLFLSIPFTTHLIFIAEGRMLVKPVSHSQVKLKEMEMEDEKRVVLRGRIGSSPPRCERRCSSCVHCEAIQVPTTPRIKTNPTAEIAYARGDYTSNYKPMSWKCKCGSFIFNP